MVACKEKINFKNVNLKKMFMNKNQITFLNLKSHRHKLTEYKLKLKITLLKIV